MIRTVVCAWQPSAAERYRLILPSLLPDLLARDLRDGTLTVNDLEDVVRGLGLPEETIASVKSSPGETDRLEPPHRVVLCETVGTLAYAALPPPSSAGRAHGNGPSTGHEPRRLEVPSSHVLSPASLRSAKIAPKTVYAVEDHGLLSPGTRWKPRRMACVERPGAPPLEHAVKLSRDRASAAALISEWVSGQLFRAGEVAVLDGRLVIVDPKAKPRLNSPLEASPVPPGLHFGTLFRRDVEHAPEDLRLAALADPRELVNVWVFDTWLCNIDRRARGNLLMTSAEADDFHLIAADQSDCFGGNQALLDGSWRKIMRQRGAAESYPCLQAAIASSGGSGAIERALEKVDVALANLDAILAMAPNVWWQMSGLRREEMRSALRDRRLHLERILDLPTWRNLDRSAEGGIVL